MTSDLLYVVGFIACGAAVIGTTFGLALGYAFGKHK
jgi:hypothetical protein